MMGIPRGHRRPYTIRHLTEMLIDKGHRRDWAEQEAAKDWIAMNNTPPGDELIEKCDICRCSFTPLEMKYHSHPCE